MGFMNGFLISQSLFSAIIQKSLFVEETTTHYQSSSL